MAKVTSKYPGFNRVSLLWMRLYQSSLIRNTAMLYVVHFTSSLLPLVMIPYLARVLSPIGYGLGVYAQSFAGIFNVVLDYGFALTATREIAAFKHDLKIVSHIATSVLWAKITLTVMGILVFGLLVLLVPSLRNNGIALGLALLGAIANTMLPTWLFQGLEKLTILSGVSLVTRTIQLPLIFVLVRSNDATFTWLAVLATTNILSTLLLWFLAVKMLGLKIGLPKQATILEELQRGFAIFFSQAAVSFYTVANTFILGSLTNLTIAAFFGAAERLVRIVFQISSPIGQAVFPRVSQLASISKNAAMPLIRKSLFIMVALGVILSLLLFLFSKELVSIILGTRFSESIPIVQLLSPLPILFSLGTVLGVQILVPFRVDKGLLVVYVCAAVINVIFAVLLAPQFHGKGMAVAVLISEITVVGMQSIFVLRHDLNPFKQTFGI
jgi:polysaccharide transporter, PST family